MNDRHTTYSGSSIAENAVIENDPMDETQIGRFGIAATPPVAGE